MRYGRFLVRMGLCALVLLSATARINTADPPKEPVPKINLDDFLLPDPDVEWLKRSKVPTDDAGLIRFLKSCQGPETPPTEIDGRVVKLMTGTPAEQTDAARNLAEIGTVAVPALRRHTTGPDAAAARRVRDCLQQIEEAGDKPVARPAMRRLLIRRPPGVAEALLGYLPFASDPAAEEDVYYGLDELAGKDPKVLPTLAGALKDAQPARRAVAACILGRRGDDSQKAAVRELLKDPAALVRLRAAQGLLAGRDKGGMPTLIDLLDDPSVEVRWQAEELLRWTAIDTAPTELAGPDDPAARRACQAAWRKWWAEQGDKLDLAEVEKEPRRPLLLLGCNRATGRVWLFGSDGATRHEWTTKKGLEDIQYVPGGTVLTLHGQPVREKPLLAERDRAGGVVWQHEDMADPKYCQRLSSGRVFVAEREFSVEPYLRYQVLRAGGHVVATQPANVTAVQSAHAFRMTADGRVVCARVPKPGAPPDFNRFHEYDPVTDTVRILSISAPNMGLKPYLEGTADGGYLLSGFDPLRPRLDEFDIAEYDFDGEQVWRYKLPDAAHATRLGGGTTVACQGQRVAELSIDRRLVGETVLADTVSVARACVRLVRFGFDRHLADLDLETSVEHRVRYLRHPDARVRRFAIKRLAEMRHLGAAAIPALRAHGDPDESVRQALQMALKDVGAEEIPQLIAQSVHPDADTRYRAVGRLGGFRGGPGVIDALLGALKDDNARVRWIAVRSLGLPGPDPQSRHAFELPHALAKDADRITSALLNVLEDKDDTVRQAAIRGFSTLGRAARSAGPALVRILREHPEERMQARAAWALGRVGSPDVAPELLHALKKVKDPESRFAIADGLSHLTPVPKEAARVLIDTYSSPDFKSEQRADQIKELCIAHLQRIMANDQETLTFFRNLLRNEAAPERHRLKAAAHLLEFGPDPQRVVQYLRQWSTSELPPSQLGRVIQSLLRNHQKRTARGRL